MSKKAGVEQEALPAFTVYLAPSAKITLGAKRRQRPLPGIARLRGMFLKITKMEGAIEKQKNILRDVKDGLKKLRSLMAVI